MDLFDSYLGGSGVAIKLLGEECQMLLLSGVWKQLRLAGLRACILNYLHLLIHGLYEVAIIKSLSKFKREGCDK
jgi:hypothetical protein